MSTTINPTPGRIVWYRGADGEIRAAIVVRVNGQFNLNLYVFPLHGRDTDCCLKESVTHADPEQEPGCFPSWHWMPYQKQQVEKHASVLIRGDEPRNIVFGNTITSDAAIEHEIQAKGKTAPRVTPDGIEANIASEHYFTAEQGAAMATADQTGEAAHPQPLALRLLTFCVLILQNGFTVTGESACASPENFDAEIGRKIARQNAVQKIWPLMGYQLRDELHRRAVFDAEPKVGGQLIANGSNPHYKGQFEGETAEQAAARRAAAAA